MRRRAAILVLLAGLSIAAVAPPAASGHATLEGSSPARGATVKEQPGAVVFRFDEPVEGSFGAVRVYDADGGRVDKGEAFHPGGEGRRLGVHLEPGLPEGSYTATYRVVSADGHVVAGGFVFSIGRVGAPPKETVAELVAGGDSGTATAIGMAVSRGLQYGALALALGGISFLLLIWWPVRRRPLGGEPPLPADLAFERRLRRALLVAAGVGAASAAAGVLFEAAEAAGVSAGAALDPAILREELGTRFGTIWGLTALAWVLVGVAVVPAFRQPTPGRVKPLLVPLAFVALEPALSGHASTQPPVAVLFPANVLHVGAMSVWVGGLATLLLAVPAATQELEPAERSGPMAAILARFSPLALGCVALLLATGVAQAYVYVGHLDNLLDTAYGRAVLIKFLLLALALIPLGAYNRYRSVPRLERIAAGGEPPGRAGLLLRRALRGEVALLVVVLGVTGALAGYPPATSTRSGPFSDSAALGPAELEMTVDPATVGPNQVHLYLFDARTGAQYTAIEELGVSATLPDSAIGPLPLEPRHAGPGHYTVHGAPLSVPGDWEIEVSMRVSAFDEYAADIEVPVR